jgi:hypothetical protein
MSDGGKGSKPRPFSVDKETFDNNFDKIFGKKEDNTGVTQNEYQDVLSTEDCFDDIEQYKLQAQELWNDSCTSQRKK